MKKTVTVKTGLVICILLTLAGCSHDSEPQPKCLSDSAVGSLAKIDVDLLGPAFRQAVEQYANKRGQFRGLAVISSHGNLVLVSIDLGDRTERALASLYFGDGSYWKVEDLNESNRAMLTLLRGDEKVDTADPREETQ